MIENEGIPPDAPPPFKNRRWGLILFGIVQIVIGLCVLGMAALQAVLLSVDLPDGPDPAPSPAMLAVLIGVYVLFAAGWIVLGIGSILCRRWARAITLALSWVAVVFGICALVFLVAISGALWDEISREAGEDGAVGALVVGALFAVAGFFYVVLPAVFVLFYRSPHVKATCEHYDAQERWTDRYPMPVAVGGLFLLLWSTAIFTPFSGGTTPFFGVLLTGPGAWIYALVFGVGGLVLAWGFFRRERWAWLGTMILGTVAVASGYLSFRGENLLRWFEAAEIPPEELEMMTKMGLMDLFPNMMLVSGVMMMGFYLWLGKYFPGEGSQPAAD